MVMVWYPSFAYHDISGFCVMEALPDNFTNSCDHAKYFYTYRLAFPYGALQGCIPSLMAAVIIPFTK